MATSACAMVGSVQLAPKKESAQCATRSIRQARIKVGSSTFLVLLYRSLSSGLAGGGENLSENGKSKITGDNNDFDTSDSFPVHPPTGLRRAHPPNGPATFLSPCFLTRQKFSVAST